MGTAQTGPEYSGDLAERSDALNEQMSCTYNSYS